MYAWITSFRIGHKIRDLCLKNRKKSLAPLTVMINNTGIGVSTSTIQRPLTDEKRSKFISFIHSIQCL